MLAIEAGLLKSAAVFKLKNPLVPKNMQDAIDIQSGKDVGWGEAALKSVGSLGLWNLYRHEKKRHAAVWQALNNASMTNALNDPNSYVPKFRPGMPADDIIKTYAPWGKAQL